MISENVLHYKILEKLGEGGMGIVYKAHDTKLDRTVALKFLPHYLSTDQNEKERFYHEARTAASLNHHNIAVIYEIGEYEHDIFLAMEYVEGSTLKKLIENKNEPLTVKKVLEIAIQICEGLEEAHEKGIVHRDIKSDNIMMTSKGQIKIMDFGLAKLKGASRITMAGSTVGTAAYMSPEQAQGEDVDQRSDIFSLGVVLYELLTTHLPFSGEHQAALIYSLINEDPQPVARYNNKIPPELERIVFKALAKDKEDRYQHVDDLLADLRRERKNLEYAKTGYIKTTAAVPVKVEEKKKSKGILNKKFVLIITPAFLLVILAVIFLIFNPFKSSKENPASGSSVNSLAVMYFENITDPADTKHNSEMLTNLLITSLSQVRGLEVISRERLLDIQKDLGQTDKTISASFASNIAKHAGVTTMLIGSILQEDPNLAVTTRLIDVQSGNIISSQQVTNFKPAQIFNLVDTLALLIQNNLRSTSGRNEEIKSVQDVTTSSPEAYRAFLEGVDLMNKIYWSEAIAAFSRAIELDKNFAIAYYYLSRAQVGFGDLETSVKSLKKAVELAENTTERERLQILSANYLMQNDFSKAIETTEKLIELYPHEMSSYVLLGYNIYDQMLFKPDKAIETLKRGINVEPSAKRLWNLLAYSYTWANRKQDAINTVNKYVNLVPAEPNPYDTKGDIYAWFREYDSSIASYETAFKLRSNFGSAYKLGFYMVLKQQYEEALKYFQAGDNEFPYIEAHQGRLQTAAKKLLELSDSEIITVNKLRSMISFYYEMGQYSRMLQTARQLAAYSEKNPVDKIRDRDYLAWALIKNGRSADAWNIHKELQKDADNVSVPEKITVEYLSALLSFEDNKYNRALQIFRKINSELPAIAEPKFFYAITLLKTGHISDAIQEFRRTSDWPGTNDNFLLSLIPGALLDWPVPAVKSHYWLGIAYATQGNKDKSVAEFKKFLEIWKDADFNSPEIVDAKLQLNKLE